jgi:hypothetical protein
MRDTRRSFARVPPVAQLEQHGVLGRMPDLHLPLGQIISSELSENSQLTPAAKKRRLSQGLSTTQPSV